MVSVEEGCHHQRVAGGGVEAVAVAEEVVVAEPLILNISQGNEVVKIMEVVIRPFGLDI
jgi:hypothetical protein